MSETTSIAEAERMDRHYRYQRYVYDGTRTHYLVGRRHLIRNLAPAPGHSVLELGCGTAWNLVRAAKLYPQAQLFGVDVSNAMLATARTALQRNALNQRVTLRQGDAASFDAHALFDTGVFDRVFFSYALSMIPSWREALQNAAGLLAPRGELHIVDFGLCEGIPTAARRALFAFLRHYTVTPRSDLENELRKTAASSSMTLRFERLHRGYTDYAVLTRER